MVSHHAKKKSAPHGDEERPATRADGRALAALGTAPTEIGMSNPANG